MSRLNFDFFQNKPEILVGKKAPAKYNQPIEKKTSKGSGFASNDTLDTTKKEPEVFGTNSKAFSNEPVYISDLKYNRHFDGSKPIPNTTVERPSKRFDDVMYTASYTPRKLADEALYDVRVVNNPKLETSLINFSKTLSSRDKEALMYVKELLTRKPIINEDDLSAIFDKLTEMSNTQYDSRIPDKKELVIAALHDISAPEDISQEGIGTCTGTTIQIQMAIRNPKEYVNMLDKLAKNESYTTLAGASIPPNWTFVDEDKEGGIKSRRTIAAKVMQNAIMDFADANTRNFDSSKGDGGLSYEQTSGAIKSILKQDVKTYEVWQYSTEQLLKAIEKSNPRIDNPIEISLSYETTGRDSFHSVSVINISRDTDKVTIINPWGREETFPLSELNKRIMSVSGSNTLDLGVKKLDSNDTTAYNTILDDNKKVDFLNNTLNTEKIDFVANTTGLHFYSSEGSTKTLSANDKKVAIAILSNTFKDDILAPNDRVYDLLVNTVGKNNIPTLITKLDNGTPEYQSLKVKLEALKK